jgi:UDP-N-acetylmuramyl pentapeptide synthase
VAELGENSTAADEHLGRLTVSDSLWLVGTNQWVHFFDLLEQISWNGD